MSILSHLGDVTVILHVVDEIHNADDELHAAVKGQEIDIQIPASVPRIKTRGGRHFRIPFIPLVADDDPKPPKP